MKKVYVEPEFEVYSFKLAESLLNDDISYYGGNIRASGETPIPGYNEDIDI